MYKYLAHFGIPGMKWGVRKKEQNTSQRHARYKVSKESIQARKEKIKELKKRIKYDTYVDSKTAQKRKDTLSYQQEELKNDKIKLKLNQNGKSISGGKYYQKKLKEYSDKGYSKEEAEINAYRCDRGRKFAIGLAAVGMAAVAAYGGFKYYKNNVDGVLKKGTDLQNISSFKRDKAEALYTSHNPIDNVKYRGAYGHLQQGKLQGAPDIYKNTIRVHKDIKVASHKSAEKIITDLMKTDTEYANGIKNLCDDMKKSYLIMGNTKGYKTFAKAQKELESGRPGKYAYRAANILLTAHDNVVPGQDARNKKLYDALKTAGYSALRDYHDEAVSGYHALSANIIFDGADKMSIHEIENISKNKKKAVADMIGAVGMQQVERIAPKVALMAGSAKLTTLANNKVRENNDNKIIEKYKKAHPGTKLSTEQILKNYYN